MPEKRVTVWVQRFKDRDALMLQWIDPETGRRKSKSAETADPDNAEQKRADLEYELNHGKYQEASRMTWEASGSCSRPSTWPPGGRARATTTA